MYATVKAATENRHQISRIVLGDTLTLFIHIDEDGYHYLTTAQAEQLIAKLERKHKVTLIPDEDIELDNDDAEEWIAQNLNVLIRM